MYIYQAAYNTKYTDIIKHKTKQRMKYFFYKEWRESCENALFPVKLGKRWALFKHKSFPDILPFLTTDVLKRAGMNKIC